MSLKAFLLDSCADEDYNLLMIKKDCYKVDPFAKLKEYCATVRYNKL